MAGVEVLAVKQAPRMPDIIKDAYLDRPAAHTPNQREMLRILGWVIGAVARAVAVEIAYRNRVIGVAPIDIRRRDVESSHPSLGETPCGFARMIDVSELAPEFQLDLRLILDDGSRVGLGAVTARHGENLGSPAAADDGADAEQQLMSAARSQLDSEIDRLIEAGLAGRKLPKASDPGFLDRLNVLGRRTLVIGTYVGDFARALRIRSAGMVDVLEPDPQLVAIERLVTARRDISRVFFHERDISKPESYASAYGLVFAPRGIDGIEPALPRIAKQATVFVTILPIKRGEPSVPESLRSAFPVHELLADGAASNGGRTRKRSEMVALATGQDELDSVLRVPTAVTEPVAGAGVSRTGG